MIRASKTTAVRYERDRPGELVHMDVKKIGRIPDGGGWRAHGRQMGSTSRQRKRPRIGYDYVHSVVDDHSRLAYSEIHRRRDGPTPAPRSSPAPSSYFAAHGIDRIERVMTDNALELHATAEPSPHVPRQPRRHATSSSSRTAPGRTARSNASTAPSQTEWAYRQVFTTNDERTAALAPWLDYYNHRRRHSALGGLPPISRLSPT